MESEFLCPDTNHTPCVKYNDADHDGVEHCFGGKLEVLLDGPESEDADELGGDADNEEIGQGEGVVRDDGILEGGYYCYSCVQRVTEEEVTYTISEDCMCRESTNQ